MLIRHSLEQINDYRNSQALNQSLIKVLIKDGIDEFLLKQAEMQSQEETYEEKDHFIIGNAVDHHFAFGEASYRSNYYLSELEEKPKDTPLKILKRAFSKVIKTNPEPYPVHAYIKELWEACNEEEYYMNRYKSDYLQDTRMEAVIKDNGVAYWEDLKKANGKQVLTLQEDEKIDLIIQSFESHPHTAGILNLDLGLASSDNYIVIMQTPLYFTYEGVECKALPDVIVIDLLRKGIIIGDIKTTMEDILNFNRAIKRHRYDLQAAFYYHALRENMQYMNHLCNRYIDEFHFSQFGFLTETTKNPGTPMVFVMDQTAMDIGRKGDDKYVLGWEQGIEKYKLWKNVDFRKEAFFSGSGGMVEVGYNFNYTKNF